MMRITIDEDACTGHGRCYDLAPDLFDADDAGFGVVSGQEVPPGREEAAAQAASNCPEGAISIVP